MKWKLIAYMNAYVLHCRKCKAQAPTEVCKGLAGNPKVDMDTIDTHNL